MSFLDDIRPQIEQQVRERQSERSLKALKNEYEPGDHRFRDAIRGRERLSLIAEFKRSSPSRGEINPSASLSNTLQRYDRYADAISILTEPDHFSGHPSLLREAEQYTDRPLLRKDFVIDPYQVHEARYFGADAVLLIEGMLSGKRLQNLVDLIQDLGMDALVECHDPDGLQRVLDTNARMIGINNRNLETLEIDPDRTRRLVDGLDEGERSDRIIVAESGMQTRSDLLSVEGIADAVLVGTAIMDAPVPDVKLKELTGETLVKFCGITTSSDARAAVDAGADVLGLNFYEQSSRYIDRQTAANIAGEVREEVLIAGVFVNEDPSSVRSIAEEVGLDLLQFSGDESPVDVRDLRGIGLPIMKAVHLSAESDPDRIRSYDADYLMVDADVEGRYGGTGERVDTGLIEKHDLDPRALVIAGGLTPENAGEVQDAFDPLMLDVCSGIESGPGRKEPDAMDAFMRALSGGREKKPKNDPAP